MVPDPLFVYLVRRDGTSVYVVPSRRAISPDDMLRLGQGGRLDAAFESQMLDSGERTRFADVMRSVPGVDSVDLDTSTRVRAYILNVDSAPTSNEGWATLEALVGTQVTVAFQVSVTTHSIP